MLVIFRGLSNVCLLLSFKHNYIVIFGKSYKLISMEMFAGVYWLIVSRYSFLKKYRGHPIEVWNLEKVGFAALVKSQLTGNNNFQRPILMCAVCYKLVIMKPANVLRSSPFSLSFFATLNNLKTFGSFKGCSIHCSFSFQLSCFIQ